MSTVPTQIRIDADIKKQATELFSNLGLDMSSAVNLFLYQCVMRDGLPFSVEMPRSPGSPLESRNAGFSPYYSQSTLNAMDEARRISRDSSVKGYTNMEDLQKALLED